MEAEGGKGWFIISVKVFGMPTLWSERKTRTAAAISLSKGREKKKI